PGGTGWSQPATVAQTGRGHLLATFNSGFLMHDSMGGFWQNGNAVGHLKAGRASMVFSDNGRLDIRAWEGGPVPAGVAAVRQNLTLLIDNGQITDAVTHADSGAFGKTLGDTTYVWRSGVGIRADGSIVTVHGNALSVQTLAGLLLDAGAVRAMQLDINRDWTSYIYYRHTPSFAPVKLTADQVRPADRYLQTSTRDFVAVAARS
ncbi:MAG TPA: phosphodiester glycosidase family protein, partial [Propionicimonas sp.]